MMKKFALVAMSAALAGCLGLTACSSSDDSTVSTDDATQSETTTQESTEESNPTYEVTIDSVELAEDYEGNPAAKATFTWTNTDDQTTSPAAALLIQCFQNGVECSSTIESETTEEYENYTNDVQPGYSSTFSVLFEIDDTSDVDIEVINWASFTDDNVLAQGTYSLE